MKLILKLCLFFTAWRIALCSAEWCPRLFHKRVLELDVNPAYLNADEYDDQDGKKSYGLTISSFFHHTFSYNNSAGVYLPNQPPFAPDQVGRIENILHIDDFDFTTDYEKVTGPETTWPNDARRIPDGVLPFEAIIVPQGFHSIPSAGRLSIVNLDDENRTEYVVHEGSLDPPFDFPFGVDGDKPRFFHKALFHDMDGDGLLDIVTVRSQFKLSPSPYPPFSELVYYKNPGEKLDPKVEWEETVLYGDSSDDRFGPDIYLAMHDFDGDGTPEIVATHFFSGDEDGDPSTPPTRGKIAMYGAPFQGSWSDVNANNPPRVKLIDDSQGFPFSIEIVDLNGDGKMEILATNHQPNCMPFPGIQGRVYALEQPASGIVFDDDWTVHVLLDGILPQPTPAGARGMRLAPGHAIPFFPNKQQDNNENRPWILLSGDESGKVWVMKPRDRDFEYETAIVFDINDYYGNGTTQTFTSDGLTVSTIGEPAIFYTEKDMKCEKEQHGRESMTKETKHGLKGSTKAIETSPSKKSKSEQSSVSSTSKGKASSTKGSKTMRTKTKGSARGLKVLKRNFLRHECVEDASAGSAEIYVPVFEAKEIHVFSFDEESMDDRVDCPLDVTYACQ